VARAPARPALDPAQLSFTSAAISRIPLAVSAGALIGRRTGPPERPERPLMEHSTAELGQEASRAADA